MPPDAPATSDAPAAAAPTTSTAETVTPTPPASAEPGLSDAADSQVVDGAPAADPTKPVDPPAPTVDKLTKWSQKLTRREDRLRQQAAEFERQKAEHAAAVESAKLFENKQLRPILDAYAKKHGVSVEDAYSALTREIVSPGEKTVDELVEEKLAKRDEAQKQQSEKDRVSSFQRDGVAYVKQAVPASQHKYLKAFDPELIANFAVNVALEQFHKTGKHEPLDKILADMNTAEEKRYNLHRQLEADSQVPQNSERAGAVEPAKPEARKRGTTTQLNNAHASQKATAPNGKEDLSDKALAKKAAEALRSIPGWH